MADENETTAMWKEVRRDQQDRRAARLPERQREIEALRALGYRVRVFTEYQYRINARLDLYPVHRLYHDVKTNRRGTYTTAASIAARLLT